MQTTTSPQQPYEKGKLLAYLILAAVAITCFVSLIGCNPQKKLEKAYMLVVTDSAKMEDMKAVVQYRWPCIPAIGKPGKVTTVTNTVIDTAQVNALQKKLDSLLTNQVITPSTNIDSLKKALIAEIMKNVKPKIIDNSSYRVDTVPDSRAIEIMQRRIDAALQSANQLQGQVTAKDKEILTTRSDGNHWRLYAIGTWSLLGLIAGISIYLKFFTPVGGANNILNKLPKL